MTSLHSTAAEYFCRIKMIDMNSNPERTYACLSFKLSADYCVLNCHRDTSGSFMVHPEHAAVITACTSITASIRAVTCLALIQIPCFYYCKYIHGNCQKNRQSSRKDEHLSQNGDCCLLFLCIPWYPNAVNNQNRKQDVEKLFFSYFLSLADQNGINVLLRILKMVFETYY